MKRATCSDARGFTLIEMLVAITLLAVMAVMGWRGLDAMTRGRERLVDHDQRLDALKLLYGQFQTDCENLARPEALQQSPVELEDGRLLLVRDRREPGMPSAWQVVAYRVENGAVVRAATGPLDNRQGVQTALIALRQPGGGGELVRPLVPNAEGLAARAWVEPGGWRDTSGELRAALRIGAASAVPASNAQIGVPAGALRGLELVVLARMGDGDTPRRFDKLCMTGQ
ncbi:prepilin-type N-terminal cleavage/methylation domain-containing protein [Cupriavidus gilardii]|uniref:PulJ/GspJ family protein n=1 Tax=Cupriavidus gilardii TaxID=82541 RepID=UPI001ABDDF5E|nr:prepilin-type N-terminal cleavage/methylation domain-containing protein [Cupriavidus gilardii]MBO4121933.1 prepilin-type N-terminal cleavage/methylation domain-containing protein [Cupriavidus gilardii]